MSQRNVNKVGTIVAVVLGVVGLAAVGFMVFMAIALQSLGSSK